MRGLLYLLAVWPCLLGHCQGALDLSALVGRGAKQLGGDQEGGIALGLVSALQKWANSLETETSSLRKELGDVKSSNLQLVKQIQIINSENLNLKNQVGEANLGSMNLKDNYVKAQDQIDKVKQDNANLNRELRGHKDVLSIQIESSRSNKETISLLQGQLFVAETSLGALQGKLDRFQVETSDQLAVILTKQDDMTADLAALTANFTGYKSKTDSTTAEINVNLDSIRLSHAKALTDMSSGFNSTLKNLVTRTEANRKNIDLKHETVQDKFESSFNNLKTQTLQYISSANSQLETVGRNLEAVSKDVENVNNSVQAVGQKVVEVKEQVEDVTTEAAGNKKSIQRLETFQSEMTGKLTSVLTDNQRLEGRILDLETSLITFNRSHSESSSLQMNTMKGLERLGDSLATLKGDMFGEDYRGQFSNLTSRLTGLEDLVDPIVAKAATADRLVEEFGRVEERVDGSLFKVERRLDAVEDRVENNQLKLQGVDRDSAKFKSVSDTQLEGLATSLTNTRNALAQIMTRMASLESQAPGSGGGGSSEDVTKLGEQLATLKTNVIGLGNYINSVNRELNNLSGKTKSTVELFSTKLEQLSSSVSDLEEDLRTTQRSKNDLSSLSGYSSKAVELEISRVASMVQDLAASLFGLTNEVTVVKAGLSRVQEDNQNKYKARTSEIRSLEVAVSGAVEKTDSTRAELSNLRSGLAGLTNNILSAKSSDDRIKKVEKKVSELSVNMTGVAGLATSTLSELTQLKPEVSLIGTDILNMRSGIARLSTVFNSVTDPARFSCGVTGEEVRVSGVIVYDECTVNFNNMMNKGTGHATVPTAGDYMLSFTANMVSSKSQAVWCALYKQSPGDEGWQVLGMINNYQEDAGEVDDRDSGSLTILTQLKEGDQVWVEWRGYGDSFLYSNPYKLISFSGYLIAAPQ